MSSRHKGQMDEKEKRLPPLNLTLKLIERLRNAKSKQTNCNVLAHNNNPPTPLSPMNTERDNSRCNFVILLNNVTRYPCQHIPRFFSLFRPISRLACTQIRMSITGVWQATFANRSVKRSFTKTGTRKYAYFVNRPIRIIQFLLLLLIYSTLFSHFVYREVVVQCVDVYPWGRQFSRIDSDTLEPKYRSRLVYLFCQSLRWMKRDGETERRWCNRYFSTSILRLAYQYSSDMRNFIILPFRSTSSIRYK